jgi:Peptidase C10 family/FG-GAP-like repeat/Carboxypeptidase regulatory-like domain/Spi protease inhibitor
LRPDLRSGFAPRSRVSKSRFAHWLLASLILSSAWRLPAKPTDRVAARSAANGWLADGQPHLGARIQSRIKSVESFNGFHVVHLEPEGFIVMAADDDLEPVLAFSDHGDFKYDPESPLDLMLDRDIPARTQQLRDVRARRANQKLALLPTQITGASADDAILDDARRAGEKWQQYQNHFPRPPASAITPVARAATAGSTATVPDDDNSADIPPTPPIHIQSIQVVNGHIQLTHDAPMSVSIYSSYDFGRTWQVEDAGIVWPTWTAKRPVQEASCWYRIATDQVYDETAVSMMRNPPPATAAPEGMTNDYVSDPGPGLAASVGSVSDLRVAPLIQSTWNQSSEQNVNCYNYYTPNNDVSGCVATMISQLMRYWQHPTAAIGQVSRAIYVNGSAQTAITRGGNGSGGAYNWSAMPLSPSTATYNAAQWQMIGSLLYDAGVGVNMEYTANSSGAYTYMAANALTSVFQYSNAKYINRPSDLITPTASNLAAGCPVLFGISSSGSNGHAVVCDGFGYQSGSLYFHINMGWDGSYDYWYALPNLETPYNFNSIDTIIYNIFPTGTGELLTGRIMTSQGAPIQDAIVVASAGGQTYGGGSDSKGYYGIKVPSATSYSVTASKAGMSSGTRTGVAVGTSGTSACGNVSGISFTLNNNFSLTAVGLTNSVWLRWSAPTNSGMPNNTVYVRSRTDHYPANSTDGTLVYSGTAQAYEHTGVDRSGLVTNYYMIWGNNGSSYASLGSSVNAYSMADPGTVRLIWTGAAGEVTFWNLKSNGLKKSAGYVTSSLMNLSYWSISGFKDIDGDGIADILWTGAGGEVVYWLLNADGTLKTSGSVTPGVAPRAGQYGVAGFGDINGDHTADVLWQGSDGTVSYWMLNANGTRKSSGLVTPGVAPRSGHYNAVGFGDINRDGVPDILWQGSDGTVSYWMLNADGTRKSSGLVTPGVAPRSGQYTAAGFADIDGDGTPDVLWVGGDGAVSYWMLNADGTRKSSGLVSATKLSPANYWKAVGFKDIDGDGVPDIIWRGQGGETSCWFLNSNGTLKSSGTVGPVPMSASYWTVRGTGSIDGH